MGRRCVAGDGEGAENKRGIFSGLLQEGYACGNLLAALCYFFVFPRWGWRPMFFIGGIPALLALYVRMYVQESEVWERTRHRDLAAYVRGRSRRTGSCSSTCSCFMTMMNFVSHGTQDMYPTFLKRDWNFTPQRVAMVTMIANVGAIPGGIALRALLRSHRPPQGDRHRALLAIVAIPLWAFAPTFRCSSSAASRCSSWCRAHGA